MGKKMKKEKKNRAIDHNKQGLLTVGTRAEEVLHNVQTSVFERQDIEPG